MAKDHLISDSEVYKLNFFTEKKILWGTNFAHGSQPLNPTTALILGENWLPFSNFPRVKQVAQYREVAAPILKPPTPSLTVEANFRTGELTMFSKNKADVPQSPMRKLNV